MLRRETMIALRARHESFRVASDVAHPHLDVPPPPEPPLPLEATKRPPPPPPIAEFARDSDRLLRRVDEIHSKFIRLLMSDVVLSLIGIAAGFAVILLFKYG